jgi:predicted acetyltransferase
VSITIRALENDELIPYLAALEVAAGRHPVPANVRDGVVDRLECARLAAFDGDAIVGGTAYDILELTLPGPALAPAARIMLTGVLPTYRRQGIAMNLMRQQLGDIQAAGLPLAIFTTSGPGLYDRLGYSPASVAMSLRCATEGASLRNPPSCRVCLIGRPEAMQVLPRLFDTHRQAQPGQVSRTAPFWKVWFRDRKLYRPRGTSERFIVLAQDREQDPRGYLAYRLRYGELRQQPVREVLVEELIALDDEARLALWNFGLGFKQAPLFSAAHAPSDEPLVWALDDVRSLEITGMREFLWLRLVDAPHALRARRYEIAGDLVLEISDPVLASNRGRFHLRTEAGGSAECEPVDAHVDISLDIAALATAYLGATTFTTLARAGRLRSASPSALRRADLLFGSAPAPWAVMDW